MKNWNIINLVIENELYTVVYYSYLGGTSKWSVKSIHSKNYVAIIHLLVALATHFHANIRLPEYVSIPVVVLSKENNKIKQVISISTDSTLGPHFPHPQYRLNEISGQNRIFLIRLKIEHDF